MFCTKNHKFLEFSKSQKVLLPTLCNLFNKIFEIYSIKKLRKLCVRGYDKRSTPFLDFLISESYEVSNLLQKGALFEFLAPIVA